MLYYSLVFLLVAIVAGVLGFTAIAGTAGLIAKILFAVFLVMFWVSLRAFWDTRAPCGLTKGN
jgi:uncharacterized membrane protein YtjA (UPF0391 family)